jgi:flagellar basal-body rod protein FlgB
MAGFTLFGSTQQLLSLSMRMRSMRHEILAGNIANADTPGYRAKDLEFSAALQSILGPEKDGAAGSGPRVQLIASEPADVSNVPPESLVRVRQVEGKLDDNSVDLDKQIATLVENSLSYETSLTLLGRTLANLRYAISEGRR